MKIRYRINNDIKQDELGHKIGRTRTKRGHIESRLSRQENQGQDEPRKTKKNWAKGIKGMERTKEQ